MLVQFMKVAEGKEDAWLKLERETWKPMHALHVKDGGIKSWAVIAQAMPGDKSNNPTLGTVTTFQGWPDPTRTNWTDLMKKAHPQGNADSLFQQTEDARRIVRAEIWQVLDQTDPTTMGGTKSPLKALNGRYNPRPLAVSGSRLNPKPSPTASNAARSTPGAGKTYRR